jgi:hypothetical protein
MRTSWVILSLGLAGCGSRTGNDLAGLWPMGAPDGAGGGPDADAHDALVNTDGPPNEVPPLIAPLSHCVPGEPSRCPADSSCVAGCPYGQNASIPTAGGLCSVPGRESCGCGAVVQPCTTQGSTCLMPSCCDNEGLCVTPDEQAAICAGPDAVRFQCALAAPVCPSTPPVPAQACSSEGEACSYPPGTAGACFTEDWTCTGGTWQCSGNLCPVSSDCPVSAPQNGNSCTFHYGYCTYPAPDGSSSLWSCTCYYGVQNCSESSNSCVGEDASVQSSGG